MTGWCLLALTDDLLNLLANRLEVDAERFKRLGGYALTLVNQPEQDVLCADVVVVEQLRLFLGENYYATGFVCEFFKHTKMLGRYLHLEPACSLRD